MILSNVPFLYRDKTHDSTSIGGHEELGEAYNDDPNIYNASKHRQHHHGQLLQFLTFSLALWGFVALCNQTYLFICPPASVMDVYRPSTFSDPTINLCDCGKNIDQALSFGCIYDSLAAAWLPSHCRDDELTAEFDRAGPGPDGSWPYFADANGTIPLDKSQVAALGDGEKAFWSSRDWHLAHCMFYWEKFVRMRDSGKVMERRFDRVAHVKHCRRLAMKQYPNHDLLIEVGVVLNSRIVSPG